MFLETEPVRVSPCTRRTAREELVDSDMGQYGSKP